MNIVSRIRRIESLLGARTGSAIPLMWKGKPVVSQKKWRWGDTSTFPDTFLPLLQMPNEWYDDYIALMEHIQDEGYAKLAKCEYCPLNKQGIVAKYEGIVDQHDGGLLPKVIGILERGKSEESGNPFRFRNPCPIVNYFHCPHAEDKDHLITLGHIIVHIRYGLSYHPNGVDKVDIFGATDEELTRKFDLYRDYLLSLSENCTENMDEERQYYESMKMESLKLIRIVKEALGDSGQVLNR